MKWLKTFFASFEDVPTTGLHAVTAALLALVYTFVLVVALILERHVDDAVAVTVGTFILGYLTKTSYDFHKKRTTDADTMVAKQLAQNASPPATVQVHDTDVTVTESATRPASVTVKPSVPADLAAALRGGPVPKTAAEGLG